ncbi:Spindle pole body component [Wickerhamomyces ciferrii]|uniref:Spindle pole body component n=1 Tax=Wickerhamomyces ciferrii (strain ATCC 14091 / BCRC 22168 / CBS 111 / JCM 3599 / NBRC 0793 / NRRL Y-1031 F-60-10) TaxID=1206466 RepID=K0KHU4_WICCF|nr:Spindle pole body component [Wickerhamomyces ciferrii]CCH40964.1 Spindle pole body component [Wickerhamomyces ciferrii]
MSGERPQLLRIYLNRLVRSLVPQELGDEYSKTVFEELMTFIELRSDSRKLYDIQDVITKIRNDTDLNITEFLNVIDILTKFKSTEDITKYLVFINSMKDIPPEGYTRQDDDIYNPTSLPISRGNLGRLETINMDMDSRSIIESHHGFNNAGDSFENINFDKLSDRRSLYSATPNRTFNDSRKYTLQEVLIPYQENHVKEEDILRSLPFTLEGTTSNIFPIENGSINLMENLTNSTSGIVHIILECGLLYQSLTTKLDAFKKQRISSAIKNAVMSFTSEKLTAYTRTVNNLSMKPQFSILSLTAELCDELVNLRFLHYFSAKLDDLPGNELLSLAHDFTSHGDLSIRRIAWDLLIYSIESFSKTLRSWLVNGELPTSSNEFFIYESTEIQTMDNTVNIKYDQSKVPNFLTDEMAYKCYLIGKTRNFLNMFCNETSWVNDFSKRLSFKIDSYRNKISHIYNDFQFSQLVDENYQDIISYFTDTMYTKFRLFNNLAAFKDYLLMGKGDFIQSIILFGSDLLNDPSSILSGHQLTKLLQDAVLSSTVRYKLKTPHLNTYVNNLDARILEIGHGNIGWDVFTLDYQLQPPIDQILNSPDNTQKKEYLKVFNYLWKFKRLEYLLENEWKVQMNTRNILRKNKVFYRRINRVVLIQNFLRGFILSVQRFIFEEIINTAYASILDDLKKSDPQSKLSTTKTGNAFKVADDVLIPSKSYMSHINKSPSTRNDQLFKEQSMDSLKELHYGFLISITKHKLINGSSSSAKGKISNKLYISQLNGLTNLVFKFAVTVKEFNNLVMELGIQDSIDDISSIRDNVNERFSIIYSNLLSLFGEFNKNLKVFINDLSNDDDLNMRYLGISLNQ